jgi:hypothetical protein
MKGARERSVQNKGGTIPPLFQRGRPAMTSRGLDRVAADEMITAMRYPRMLRELIYASDGSRSASEYGASFDR